MGNMNVNMNFIFFLYDTDYYRYAYNELTQYNDVRVYYGFRPVNPLMRFIHKIHHSLKFNHYLKLPFKQLWFKSYYKLDFENEGKLCFVFDARLLEFDYARTFCDYLRSQHKTAHFVCYYQDLIKTSTSETQPNSLKDKFDLIVSYDKRDAAFYNIDYHPTTYSANFVSDNDTIEPCDVYFLGAVKNRWKDIIDTYTLLTKKGLKCDFYVKTTNNMEQVNLPGIHYIKNMSYAENLQHIQKCKFILELQQKDAIGPTLRTWEAICYDKFLITNNLSIKHTKFYDNRFVILVNKCGIDFSTIDRDIAYINQYKQYITPRNFLNFLTFNLKNR